MASRTYRITVRGRLSERFASAFEGMAVQPGRGETGLLGEVTDQAQLYGLLDRLRDFGLELVRLERAAPDLVPTLHRRAAGWYREQGAIPEAIHHATAAGDLLEARKLPSRRSQREIAAALVVSPNTVKTHTRGIYNKLAASTRAQAVARARELGLL